MIHYIYKITFLKGTPEGRYYIGKRSTGEYDNWKEDPYAGSGVFCENFFEEYGKIEGVTYKKECIEENDSFEVNREREKYGIGDLGKLDPLCMNRTSGGGGVQKSTDLIGRTVYQFDLDGNLLAEYKSQLDASRITGVANSNISSCCLKKTTHANRYIWRFDKNDLSLEDISKAKQDYGLIDQYTKDCVFVKTWDSIKEAAETTGSNEGAIGACIHGRNPKRHLCNGYIWVKHGKPPINTKTVPCEGPVKVNQYDDEGNLLATYDSYRDAAEAVGGNWQGIQRVCNGIRVKHRGYIWAKEGQAPRLEGVGRKTHVVGQYTKEGVLVKKYASVKEAATAAGCTEAVMARGCRKECKTAKGYVGRYID